MIHRLTTQPLFLILFTCFILRSTDAQCSQNFAPFTSLCSGQGTCENNTRCICDANYNGVTLIFDVGDSDCPIQRLAFSALGYIQFGVSIIAVLVVAFRLITFRNEDFKSKKMIRMRNILVSMIISAALCAVYAGLYSLGGLFIYNSIASLIFYCAFWLALGSDLYFRKVNVYKLFVATSIGEDKKKLRNSKNVFGLEVFSAVFLSATQIAFGIAVYNVTDLQIRIGLTQGSAAALLVSLIINAAVPLSYAIQVRNRLSEHLKTDAANENAKAIRIGLKKIKMIIFVLFTVIIIPVIPNVLVIAMPIVHAYIFQIFLILYLFTTLQGAILVFQPSKIKKVPSTSNSAETPTSLQVGAISWIGHADAQCTQNLLPFTELCSAVKVYGHNRRCNIYSQNKLLGHGTCDNNTRCICDENYGGIGLYFDVGDTDCPTHLLAFRALAYIQFGCAGIAVILCVWRIFTFKPWLNPNKTKGQIRAMNILASILVAAAVNVIVVGLYIFGNMFQYNSIVGLIFHCAFWITVGNDIYFRKVNVYELFKAASWGNDRAKFAKRSKTVYGLEVFSAVLIPGTLIPLSIVTYCIDDVQTRIALVQAGSASLIFSFTVIGLVPLTYSLRLQKNLRDHLKSELDANKKTIKNGLRKLRMINIALMGTIVLPIIPNVLVIAMPITHVYIYHAFYILYLLTSIQGAAVLVTPNKVSKGPKSSGSTDTSNPTTLSAK